MGPPAVYLVVCSVSRVAWASFDDLDPEHGDDRLVIEALHAKINVPSRIRILSHDTRPRAGATRHGLGAARLPEHWLLAPEPSPAGKEIQRLRQKVSLLEANSPALGIDIEIRAPSALTVPRVMPLTLDEKERLVQTIIKSNPRVSNADQFGLRRDLSYDSKYKSFVRRLPQFAENYHQELELLYGQIPVAITIRNDGHVPAKDLVIEIRTTSGGIHCKFSLARPFGPVAPAPRSFLESYLPDISAFARSEDPYEIVFSPEPRRGPELRAVCADFRHGRDWTLEGVASLNPRADNRFHLSVRLTASNLNGEVVRTAELHFQTIDKVFSELVDFEQGKYIQPYPMMDFVTQSIRAKQFEVLDRQDDEED
jgi:hypothetical protein